MSHSKPQREIRLLVGLPGVGKSTYSKQQEKEFSGTIIALDKIIEELRIKKEQELKSSIGFDDIARHQLPEAMNIFNRQLKEAVERGDNILLDMIHDKPSDRMERVNIAKSSKDYDYKSIAIIIQPPEEEEHIDRLIKRATSFRRFNAINNTSLRTITPIAPNEFDEVIYVGKAPERPLFYEYNDDKFKLSDIGKPTPDKQR